MKGKIAFTNIVFFVVSSLFFSSTQASNDRYYLAVQHVQENRYKDAEKLFQTQLSEFSDKPTLAMRSKAWLALTLLGTDQKSKEAEKHLHEFLCVGLSEESFSGMAKLCSQASSTITSKWQPETPLDFEMLSSVITAFGAIQWRKGEYELALELMNLSLQQSLQAKPRKSNLQAFELLEANKAKTPEERLGTEQIRQALIKQQMKDEMLEKVSSGMTLSQEDMRSVLMENQQALAESYMTEMMAKQQQKISQLSGGKSQSVDGRKLARVAASENKIFQTLASAVSCKNEGDDSEDLNLQSMQDSQLSFVASALEAFRGQKVQSHKIIQRPVLKSLNKLLDTRQQLAAKPKPFLGERNKNSSGTIQCFDALNLQQHISQALLVALVSPARPHRNERYLTEVIDTARRLQQNDRFDHSSKDMQASIRHQVMGMFYLRANQASKALHELEQAFAKFKIQPQWILAPELAYLSQISRAKVLQGLAQASQQLGDNPAPVKEYLALLHEDIDRLQSDITHQLSLTPEQAQQAQLDQVKKQTSDVLQNEEFKGVMQGLETLLAQAEGGEGIPSPSAKLSEIVSSMNSGEMDAQILELQKQLEAGSPVTQDDVLGLNIERKYQFYNYHALVLLQLVHIELDSNNIEAATQRFSLAESHIQKFSAWLSGRTQGYFHYAHARLAAATKQTELASQAFAAAVDAWYFSPRSPYQILWSPLQFETEILEQAAALAIQQGDAAGGLKYLELARDVSTNKLDLYGALSSQGLDNKDENLKAKLAELEQQASRQAQQQGETQKLKSVIAEAQIAEQSSSRSQLDKSYPMLRKLNAMAAWLKPQSIGPVVNDLQQQISRRQTQNLNQKRIDFVYQQQGLAATQARKFQTTGRQRLEASFPKILQEHIAEDSLLLSVWMGPTSTYVIALDKKQIRAHQEPSQPLLKLVKAFNVSYKSQHGFRLYQQLLAPYLDSPYKRIVVISNGPLQNTALAALSIREDKQEWLGDQYLLRTVPTASHLLAAVNKTNKPVQTLVLDGSSVPGEDTLATSEIAAINKLYSTKHLADEQLTRQNLMTHVPQYPIVHFAGHSKVNNEFPDFSYLALYNEQAYALELEQLPLEKVKLMVLGSCESAAHADTTLGNEFSSLQESFLSAGADAVVANLFPTNDQVASDFMTEFYTLLAQGLPKDQALQKAQQHIRGAKPDPKDWAGFVLSGSESPL